MGDAVLVDENLRRAAENEMRRCLPSGDRPAKRAKLENEEEDYPQIGRFDYNCSSELANGMTCFLVSCDFRRERSATREASALLLPYLKEDNGVEAASGPASIPAAPKGEEAPTGNEDSNEQDSTNPPLFSTLKLSARGLVGLRLQPFQGGPTATAQRALTAALAVYNQYNQLETDTSQPLQHVQRIIPIASTCVLEPEALKACAARVAPLMAELFKSADQPTFGIGLNNRHNSEGSTVSIDRKEIISAIATGLTDELKSRHDVVASVDLKNPNVVVAVEVMPILGHLYVGIAPLPNKVCTMKPRLAMQSLRKSGVAEEEKKEQKKKKNGKK